MQYDDRKALPMTYALGYLIAMKYLDTMKAITSGKDNKVVYMPYEATGILSSVDGIKQMFDSSK